MKIIRGRLTAQALVPANTRYDGGCDCIQVTTDGGSTWQNAPGQDPRSQPGYLKPSLTTTDPRCDASANMVKWFHDLMDSIITALSGGAQAIFAANKLIDFLSLLFPFASYFFTLAYEIAVILLATGASDLATAFDTTTYDKLLCIFYCNIGADGGVTADQLATIETQIVDQLNTTAATIINEILFLTGVVGLANMGAIGGQTGDCAACDCCPDGTDWCETILDAAVNNDGGFSINNEDDSWSAPLGIFLNDTSSPPPDNYAWSTRAVARGSDVERATILNIYKTFPTGTYTDVRFHYAVTYGTFTTDIREYEVRFNGTPIFDKITDGDGDFHWHGSITGTLFIEVEAVTSYRNDSTSGGGGALIQNLILEGSGVKPAF